MSAFASRPTAVFADESWVGLSIVRHLRSWGWPVAERPLRELSHPIPPTWDLVIMPLSPAASLLSGGAGKAGLGAAILALYGAGEKDAALDVLEAGADDCFPTSGSPRELLARVRAILRRRHPARARRPGAVRRVLGECFVSTHQQALRLPSGARVPLRRRELALLLALLARPETVLSRDQLIELIIGDDADVYDRSIDCLVSRLRRKLVLATGQPLIQTFPGAGYAFRAAPHP